MENLSSSMTWDEVVSALKIGDLLWNDKIRAVAAAFGSGENEPFIDWLANGAVTGSDTIDEIYQDWADDSEESEQ
jgi:hypothetical protein